MNLDFVQAASVPMVGRITWQALTERIALRPGRGSSSPRDPAASARGEVVVKIV